MEDPDLYENNKGTIVGIAGDDFVILAADTRICSDYSIVARAYIRVHTVPPNLLVAANGCEADANAWISDIRSFGISMQVLYDQPLIPKSAASYSFVSQYKYRLFPLNISTLIGGFDEQGKGVLYVSDSPGLYHCMPYSARGASYKYVESLIDSQLTNAKINILKDPASLTKDYAKKLILEGFVCSTERSTETGDGVFGYIITKDGIEQFGAELRED